MTTKKVLATASGGEIAPTSNVALMHQVMDTLIKRDPTLPGIGCFYGPSGVGKSAASAFAAHPLGFNGVYVECRSYETMKSLVHNIIKALGLNVKGSIADQMDHVFEALSLSERPLIIDEADRIVGTKRIELLRDIHDQSGVPVLIVGEQDLPAKLKQHEHFDNRVLVWQPASLCSMSDLELLAKMYAVDIAIAPELKKRILSETGGITRRVATTLVNVKKWCDANGTTEAPSTAGITVHTGAAPGRLR
ncbi:MAG: ATP-binding protein [Ramlibacter sp.]|nr:ATP-binding protein [Ramlibacter sp.]